LASIEQSKSNTVNQPVDILFHLLSPEGEKAWGRGWNFEFIQEWESLLTDYVNKLS